MHAGFCILKKILDCDASSGAKCCWILMHLLKKMLDFSMILKKMLDFDDFGACCWILINFPACCWILMILKKMLDFQ